MIPVVVVMLIPIVAILTKHQRQMTEIIHRPGHGMPQNFTQAADPMLIAEIQQLRQLVAQQAIALDNLSSKVDQLAQRSDPISERLTQN